MVQIQRIAFYIVPSGHILKSHHGTMHWVKASTLRNEVQPPIQPLVPALIIYVALVIVSYEPEHDVNTVRVPSWRGAHSNLAQLAQRLSFVAPLLVRRASHEPRPCRDDSFFDRHDSIKVSDQTLVPQTRDKRIPRPAPTLDTAEFSSIHRNQWGNLDVGSLGTWPNDIAGLRDENQPTDLDLGYVHILLGGGCRLGG